MGGRGSASKAGGSAAKIRQTLASEENKIYKSNYETAVLVGSDGSVVFRESQHDESSVNFTRTQLNMMKGATLTHNHPHGTTFSQDDINLMVFRGLNTIRATGRDQTYQLTKINDSYNARNFGSDFDAARKASMKKIDPTYNKALSDYNAGKITRSQMIKVGDDCDRRLNQANNSWLKDNAKNYGYQYSVIKRR